MPAPRPAPDDATEAPTRLSVRDTSRLRTVEGLLDGALYALHDEQDTLRHYLTQALGEVQAIRDRARGGGHRG